MFDAARLTISFSCQRPHPSSRCRSEGLCQRVHASRKCRCCCRCKRQRVRLPLTRVNNRASFTLPRSNSTPLHVSALKGHYDVCQFLVQARADVVAQDHVYVTPRRLWLAFHTSCFALSATELPCTALQPKVTWTCVNFSSKPAHRSMQMMTCTRCVALISHQTHTLASHSISQATPLHNAALHGRVSVCAFLVHASANISARTRCRRRPCARHSPSSNHPPHPQTILRSDGRTPLDWAAYSEEQEVVQFLGRLDVPK